MVRWRSWRNRLVSAASLLVALGLLSWLAFRVLPVDPARSALGPTASEDEAARLRAELGLDQPAWRQLAGVLLGTATLDFGRSWQDGSRVLPRVTDRFARTFLLGGQAAVVALVASYVLAFGLAWPPWRQRVRPLLHGLVILPGFVTAVLAAVAIGTLLPGVALVPEGSRGLLAPWLPTLLAALPSAALLAVLLFDAGTDGRVSLPYRALLAAGVPDWLAYHRAIFRPAAATWLAAWLNQIGLILVSTLLLELVFSLPGGGALLVRSIQANDLPVLHGTLVVNGLVFIAVRVLGDIALSRLRRTSSAEAYPTTP